VTGRPDFSGEYWENHYREPDHEPHQSVPNPHLFAVAERLPTGTALDAGCGEGADAIRLAQRGWRVTGVDISATAVEKARSMAAASGLETTTDFRCTDLIVGDPGSDYYDLVTAHHVHTADDRTFIRALGSSVKPGGVLLVVGHQPLEENEADPHSPGSHATAEQVASYLDREGWDIEVAEVRIVDATSPDGNPIQDKDSVLLARKRTAEGMGHDSDRGHVLVGAQLGAGDLPVCDHDPRRQGGPAEDRDGEQDDRDRGVAEDALVGRDLHQQ
jgi:SAM-dependent methyltransferase